MAKIEPAKGKREGKILRTDMKARFTAGVALRSNVLFGHRPGLQELRPAVKV